MKTNHFIALTTALVAVGYGLGRYTYGLFVPEIRAVLGLSTFTVGLVASISHLGYITAIVLAIRLIKIFSPRTLMIAGGMSGVFGILLVGLAGNAATLALGAFTASMSAGLVWTVVPDAVTQLFVQREQTRVLGWVNSGTGVGVLVAAPVAFLIPKWQIAYSVYTAIALAVVLWSIWALPAMEPSRQARSIPLRWSWFVCPRSGPLLAMALIVGLVAAVYWTFAVDLIVSSGIGITWIGQLFWFVSGGAGVLGVGIAGIINRYGLRRVIPVNLTVLAVALVLLSRFPSVLPAVLVSAVCFGVGFITITGVLSIWSVRVYAGRPSAGMGAIMLLIAVGQVFGPVIAGAIAEQSGLVTVFYGGAFLALVGTALRPQPQDDLQLREVPSAA